LPVIKSWSKKFLEISFEQILIYTTHTHTHTHKHTQTCTHTQTLAQAQTHTWKLIDVIQVCFDVNFSYNKLKYVKVGKCDLHN